MVRLPGCDGGGETTVLAHYTSSRVRGMGQKPHDLVGAWACSSCHDIVDRRKKLPGWGKEEIEIAHLQGMAETITRLAREGLI